MKLVTIAFSHFCHRARWALDRYGIEYTDQRYVPIFHFAGVFWATRGRGGQADRYSSRWSTPVLIADDGEILASSSQIVHYASDRYGDEHTSLYPAEYRASIEGLEQRVSETVGPLARAIAYHYILDQPSVFAELVRRNVGVAQAALFRSMAPALRVGLRRALRINRARTERAWVRVCEEIEWLNQQLGGRPYLFGGRFSAADLTVAALMAPLLAPSPDQYSADVPGRDALSPSFVRIIDQVRATHIGRHAMQMLTHERRPPESVRSA